MTPQDRTAGDTSSSPSVDRVPTLDGLRALSIVFVFVAHQYAYDPFADELGVMGVRIFFIISGYIITALLARERLRTGLVSLRGFYARRTLRILPPLAAYVGSVYLGNALGLARGVGVGDLLFVATFTVNYAPHINYLVGHLWSLGVEEQFYLLWPILYVVSGRRIAVLIGVVVAVPLLRLAPDLGLVPSVNAGKSFHTVADSLATGCLVALSSASGRWSRFVARLPHAVALGVLVAGVCGSIAWARGSLGLGHVFAPSLANLAVAIFLAKEVRPSRSLSFRVLNWSPVVALGHLSYSLYLWQQPFLFHSAVPKFYTAFPLNFIIVFSLALLSYHFIELPALKLRRRLTGRVIL